MMARLMITWLLAGAVAPVVAQETFTLVSAQVITAGDRPPTLKLSALAVLQSALMATRPTLPPVRNQNVDPQIVRVLIDSAQARDQNVRLQALNILVQQRSDNPEVRALLQSVLENEPELAADLRIAQALEPRPERDSAIERRLRALREVRR